MTLEYLYLLINSSYLLFKNKEFNFIDCNTKYRNTSHLKEEIRYNDIYYYNIYRNEDILFWINNKDKVYYSFKFKDVDRIKNYNYSKQEAVKFFLENNIPVRKGLGLKGYKYNNIKDFIVINVLHLII